MIHYKAVEQTCFDPDIGSYISFGIGAYHADGREILFVPDVFLSRSKAHHLAALCERVCLAPIHLPDVIEDALAG